MIIAADVVYAVECIPDLVVTVVNFLSSGSGNMALFATTHRNERTFGLFEQELKMRHVVCDYKYKSLDEMPYVFPCYFNQPRTDVRICTMRLRLH